MDSLKEALSKAPVLRYPDFAKEFTVTTDVSDYAVGAVLQQASDTGDMHPVAFFSQKLKGSELNWTTTDKEALAQVLALKEWCCYLEGSHFVLETDHHPLVHLQTQRTLSRKQARWLDLLQQYDFVVRHVKGKDNHVADALSRLRLHAAALTVGTQQNWVDGIRCAQLTDEEAQRAREQLQDADSGWSEQDALLYFRQKLYVPAGEIWVALMQEAHASLSAGHPGIQRTQHSLSRQYYWPTLHKDVREYLRTCDFCVSA